MSSRTYRWLVWAVVSLGMLAAIAGCKGKIAGGKANGPKIYAEVCAQCHGSTGDPSAAMKRSLKVKDLTDPKLQARLSDADMERQVVKGSANRLMPSFAGKLSKQQLAALIKHVRTLSTEK